MRSTAHSCAVLCVLIIPAAFPPNLWAAPALWEASATTDTPARTTRHASPGRLNGTGAVFHITWQASCEIPPAEAVTALEYAAGLWGTWISSTVPIEVSSCWTSILNCDGDALACGGPTGYLRNFAGAPLMDTSYPVASANALSGNDLDPDGVDITLHFLAGADWSFATTTPAPTGYDFVTVALHELAHGLGFVGNMYEDYSVGFCGNGPYGFLCPCPTPYDWFAVDSAGISLLDYLTPDPRDLGALLKGDANFGGPNTIVANGGTAAKLYTPGNWQPGSSLSHLDQTTFEAGENQLMTPVYSVATRHPGPVTLAILQDMGWLRADGVPNVTTSGPWVVGVGHDAAFEAELAWTDYAGQAITATWTATDGGVITHTVRGITDSATLSWTVPSLKTVAVTAVVSGTSASATRSVLAFDVAASGSTQGDTNHTYTFDANVTPAVASFPVTYYWQATDLDPLTHPDVGTNDTAAFTWTTPGTKTITVTAAIAGATAQSVHRINIEEIAFDQSIFLPLIQQQQ